MQKSHASLKKHPSLILHQDIAAICAPLFKSFDYYIMNFIRVYEDGRVLYLCDNYDWLNHYLKNGYPAIGAFEQNQNFRNNDYVLWDALNDNDPVVIFSRKMFNIKHGITLVRKFDRGCDFFNFGTTHHSSSVLNVLPTQLEDLKKFTQIFYEKTKRLIETAQKESFSLSHFSSPPIRQNDEKKFYLGPSFNYQSLTAREIVCMKDLSKGMTVPEIANTYGLSPRTIEKHIEHIKQKLHCKTQCELGYLIAKLGIDEIIIS